MEVIYKGVVIYMEEVFYTGKNFQEMSNQKRIVSGGFYRI